MNSFRPRPHDLARVTPRHCWGSLLLLALATACAQEGQNTAGTPVQPVYDSIYDGTDRSWQEAGTELRQSSLDVGDNTLSNEPWTAATSGWGPVERDTSNGEYAPGDGKAMTLQGKTYARGFGVHANSSLSFAVDGKCQAFSADIGVDDEVGNRGSKHRVCREVSARPRGGDPSVVD